MRVDFQVINFVNLIVKYICHSDGEVWGFFSKFKHFINIWKDLNLI